MDKLPITKHFVSVGARRVHYLRAGSGPAVALLHASPCSAKVLRPLMRIFAERFTVLAFDSPGFGLSDKLTMPAPSIEDFTDALDDTLAALGVEQVATYGRHTGATIAVEYAARHPQRTAMALADGFAIFPKRYTDEQLERYLERIEPAWDGGHLLRLWFRYRDQHVFWPWNNQTAAARADTDVPELDFLHRGVVELLEAGDDYRLGYAAPFRHRELGVLADLRVPVCFGNRPGDSMYLTHHLYPPEAWTEVMPREFEAASLAERDLLGRHPARGGVPPAPVCTPLPGRSTTDYLDIDGAQVLVRRAGGNATDRPPLLLIPHAPGSSARHERFIVEEGARRPVAAFDLPGHGESDPLAGNPQDIATWTQVARAVADRLGWRAFDVRGHNGGAAVALELALAVPERVRRLTLDAPVFLPDDLRARFAGQDYAPPVEPVWDGSHWLRAWHHLRDSELWWPWCDRTRATVRPAPPRIDPCELNLRVREAMKQPAGYRPAWQAVVGYDWRPRLALLRESPVWAGAEDDTFAHLLPGLRAVR